MFTLQIMIYNIEIIKYNMSTYDCCLKEICIRNDKRVNKC